MSDDIDVLIVGGGLAGLSAAVFLSVQGVRVRLAERRGAALAHPRARTVNPRSVELFRQAGVADRVLAARSFTDHADSMLFRVETLLGAERFRSPLEPPESIGDSSPCPWAPIDQDKLEEILAGHAVELGAKIEFGVELTGFSQDREAVTADLAGPNGQTRQVRARYLIAADGNRSGIRNSLDIATHGHGTIGHTMTLVFEADLTGPLRGRRLGVCHLDRPTSGTVLLSHDGNRRWVLSVPYKPENGESLADFDDARCLSMIREAVGDPALAAAVVPQLTDGTKVLGYELAARVADQFRSGRVFLAGDSAHVVPPTGAFGASTGIADAHNLAWKLAAVLRGQAGPELLDSYDIERRPVADLTMEQALLQLWKRTSPKDAEAAVFSPLDYYATVFGYRYVSAATIDAPQDLPAALPPGQMSGQVGTRAPHVPIRRGGRELSTLDLFGDSFVLLVGPDGKNWIEGLSDEEALALVAHHFGNDVFDVDGEFCARYGLDGDGAVLVRPDGFVGWRASTAAAGSSSVVMGALSRLLCRSDRVSATTV